MLAVVVDAHQNRGCGCSVRVRSCPRRSVHAGNDCRAGGAHGGDARLRDDGLLRHRPISNRSVHAAAYIDSRRPASLVVGDTPEQRGRFVSHDGNVWRRVRSAHAGRGDEQLRAEADRFPVLRGRVRRYEFHPSSLRAQVETLAHFFSQDKVKLEHHHGQLERSSQGMESRFAPKGEKEGTGSRPGASAV